MILEGRRIALVTGGSRGIGRAISCELAERNYHIIINYVSNQEEADKTLKLIQEQGGTAELLRFDTANYDEVNQALAQWSEQNPDRHISVVINNAGIRRDNLMMWLPREDWHKVLSISLDGFYNVTQPLLKDMLVGRWGRIINIVSLSGLKGLPGQVNYSAAKGGIIAGTKALAQEVGRKGVTVNAVAPGFIATDMTQDLDEKSLKKMIPVGRFGKAEEVAKLVGFLASEDASYITGEVISINGGLY